MIDCLLKDGYAYAASFGPSKTPLPTLSP